MSVDERRIHPAFKLWLEVDGRPVIGRGGFEILEAVERLGSITKAAEELDMSYRYVWSYLSKTGSVLQEPIVEAWRGGGGGGGGARLTDAGKALLASYRAAERRVEKALDDFGSTPS